MGYMCDFCGDQRSMVYCRSDAACLCLSCDRNVHSANALSRRHSRTLVCERCNSQPAFIRCVEERISLCQNCDWLGHTGSTEASTHKKQAVNCYSGCPSAAELSTIWSFVLDIPSVGDSTCEKGMSLMSITDNSLTNSTDPSQSKDGQDVSVFIEENDVKNIDKSSDWMGSSAMPELRTKRQNVNSTSSKTCCPGTKASDLEEDDKFYEDFNMDEVDLNIENYEEIFGVALNDPEQLFGNDGIGSLFGVKDMSGADLNHRGTYAAEIPMEKHEVNSSPTNEKEILALELDLHPPNNTEVHDDDDDDDDDGDTADRPFIPNNTTDQGIDISKAALLIGFFTLISGSMISVLSNLKDSGKTETNKAELTLGFKDIFLHLDKLPDAFYNILLLTIAFTVSTVLAVVSLWPIIKDRSFWYRTILFAGVAAFFLSFGYILKDKVPKFWLTATDSFSIPSFWLVWVYGFSLVLFAVTISSAAQLLSAQLLSAVRHVG